MISRIKVLFIICLSVFLVVSCSLQKRKYSKGFYVAKKNGIVQKSNGLSSFTENKSIDSFSNIKNVKEAQPECSFSKVVEQDPTTSTILESQIDTLCDVIIFKDLKEVKCVVKEVNPETIKYTKCGFEDGPVVTIRKDKVSSILYRNGESENFSSESDLAMKTANKTDVVPKKIEPFGVVALLIGFGSWLLPAELIVIAALVIGLSIIFGFISLSRYTKEPEKYHGKIFPILALIAGLVSVIALSYWII